jgi:hypothetical protein
MVGWGADQSLATAHGDTVDLRSVALDPSRCGMPNEDGGVPLPEKHRTGLIASPDVPRWDHACLARACAGIDSTVSAPNQAGPINESRAQ